MSLIYAQADEPVVSQDRALWIEVGIPTAAGLVAHAQADYETAAVKLSEVRAKLWKIGGSHAQRDLFEQVLLDARLRAGHWDAAKRMLEQHKQWEPESPLLVSRLKVVYERLNSH